MDTKKWMKNIDGNKKLSEFTIPGTHDTGTWTLINGPAKCQNKSLTEQLEAGIRFIDIRLKPSGYEGDDDALMVWHGQSPTGLNFNDDIIVKCKGFLEKNESETIIMSIKDESKSKPRPDVFYKKVAESINLQGNLFHTGTSIPLLKDVRGKIVVIRRFPLADGRDIGINLNDNWPDDKFKVKINHWTTEDGSFYVQDEYTYFTFLEKKYDEFVEPTLDKATESKYKDYLFLNFASCTGRLWPIDISDIINKKILGHIKGPRYGIIPMDAPDDALISTLISGYFTQFADRIFESATTFDNEHDGTWTMPVNTAVTFPLLKKQDLVFIKTANTPSGRVEVHIASGDSNYQKRVLETDTIFGNENNGTWLMVNNSRSNNLPFTPGFPIIQDHQGYPDLVYIKTKNTQSGKVEVHIASASSNYKKALIQTPTTFNCENNGVWTMVKSASNGKPDLVYIKTSNTPSGRVEVHIASGDSDYKTRILETATTFACEMDGIWTMTNWDGDGIPDLVFIKTANTPSGNVEVHIASGASNYQTRILECATTFQNENNGSWLMRDFNSDGIQDLIFIKTSNTPNNHVEVHVASGAK